jgi:sugar/nucleoside kinase (ribokinase family)
MPQLPNAAFDAWMAGLEARHLATLTFAEVARALRALSSAYVERRGRLATKGSFDSAGKRAAYALYYGPLHFITVAEIVRALGTDSPRQSLLDLGCGTGAAGAAWATRLPVAPRLLGIDTHPWAVEEAARAYRAFDLDAVTRRVHAGRVEVPRQADAIIAGWMLNEVDPETRASVQKTLRIAAGEGRQVLVIEPIATRVSPWWDAWCAPFVNVGARTDEWRFAADIPETVRRLGRAAGLNPEGLTARSLYVGNRR